MRLIDADELKINMDNGMQGTAREYLKFYQMAVDDQPTAYDPDKVMQRLKEFEGLWEPSLSEVLEIVKGGAV